MKSFSKINKKILIILAVIILLAAFSFLFGPSVSFSDNRILERGYEYRISDFIDKIDGDIVVADELIDTEKVGINTYKLTVKKGFITRDIDFIYEVKDTIAPAISLKQDTIIKDTGTDYDVMEIMDNISVDEGNLEINTNYNRYIPGIYQVNISAKDDYNNISYADYKVIVVDDEPPFLFRSGDGYEILRGERFDPSDIISYGDNADPKPVLEIDGRVNTYRLGDYRLHAKVTDSSGNSTEWNFTVSVVKEIEEYEPDDYYYPFEEFVEDYAGEGRKFGIDVSEWQDEIDFEKIKEAGCEFVIMRIGFSHEGNLTLDKQFTRNITEAKRVGMPVGIYLFCYDSNEKDLLTTLDAVFAEIEGIDLELPIVFDWENFSHYQQYGMSLQMLNHLYEVFEREVKNRGYQSMLYGSKYYLQNVWNNIEADSVWLAQYSDVPTYDKSFDIWQLVDWGRIDGIDWNVDFDILYE